MRVFLVVYIHVNIFHCKFFKKYIYSTLIREGKHFRFGAIKSDTERERIRESMHRQIKGRLVKDCRPGGRPLAVASCESKRRKRVEKTGTGQGHVSAFSSRPGKSFICTTVLFSFAVKLNDDGVSKKQSKAKHSTAH